MFDDEEDAACKYDEHAADAGKPMNFPQEEGQEQAKKQRSKQEMEKLSQAAAVGEEGHTSEYVGVSWNRQKKKWRVEIRIQGKKKHLGYFDDEEEAAREFDEQAVRLNFGATTAPRKSAPPFVNRRQPALLPLDFARCCFRDCWPLSPGGDAAETCGNTAPLKIKYVKHTPCHITGLFCPFARPVAPPLSSASAASAPSQRWPASGSCPGIRHAAS